MEQKIESLNPLDKIQESGCSVFFITSSILSICTGWNNRNKEESYVKADLDFQRYLDKQKEQYEDEKEAEEVAFKLWMRKVQRKNKREEAILKFDNELNLMELQPFFKDWPLKINIKAVLDECQNNESNQLCIILGKPTTIPYGDTIISQQKIYNEIVDFCQTSMGHIQNIYRFNDGKFTNGPSLAYIYSIMSTIPSVVIMPIVNTISKYLTLRVAIWNQDSSFPYQKSVITLDYNETKAQHDKEYLSIKMEEILTHIIAIVWVLNDIYMLIENQCQPSFPDYAKENLFFEKYPKLMQFVKKEYLSLVTTDDADLLQKSKGRILSAEIRNVIKNLNF